MNKNSVYITRLSRFLPNDPVDNDDIENLLGLVNGLSSKAKPLVLRNNKIMKRYYAVDKNGISTHTNAELTKLAIEGLFDKDFTRDQIDVLSCGTTSPDQILPSHAAMVHGILGGNHIEINSSSGACSAGIQSLKFGYLSVLSGNVEKVVCTGSERFSRWMLAKYFKEEAQKILEFEKDAIIAFEKDFLRFMLSDGAGAALLQPEPNKEGLSLRLDWIEQGSYAHELPTCMYSGAIKTKEDKIIGWADLEQEQWTAESVFAIKQDTKLLGENIVKKGGEFLSSLIKEKNIDISGLTYFLPHLSSHYFGPRIDQELKSLGINIPMEKWFTNLSSVGNIGAAAPYVMLEELLRTDRFKKGDTILIMVPESARFNYAYLHITVV